MPPSDSPCELCNQAPGYRVVTITGPDGEDERYLACSACAAGVERARYLDRQDYEADQADTMHASGELDRYGRRRGD